MPIRLESHTLNNSVDIRVLQDTAARYLDEESRLLRRNSHVECQGRGR